MNSSSSLAVIEHGDSLIDLYTAENTKELQLFISGYLDSHNLKPNFSVAYYEKNTDRLCIKYCYCSVYQINERIYIEPDTQTRYKVKKNADNQPLHTKISADIITIESHYAYPFYTHDELHGYLILSLNNHEARCDAIENLVPHLGSNFSRLELLQLYIQQHRDDTIKLASVNRMTSIMQELDLTRVLAGLTELVMATVSGSAACLALIFAHTRKLEVVTDLGVGQLEVDSLVHNKFGHISDYVTKAQKVWVTSESNELVEFYPSEFLDRLSRFIIVPLVTRQGPGCILVADPEKTSFSQIEIVQSITELSQISINNAILHAQVVEEAVHGQQLKIAGKVQSSLLPAAAPEVPGLCIHGMNLPCDDTSGDYFDYIALPDQRICFVLADATGHGIGAAILATNARAMLRALLQNQPDNFNLADICYTLNQLMDDDLAEDKFITMFIGIYNTDDRSLVYVSAGHDPPLYIYCPSANKFDELEGTGLPFGMFANMEYDTGERLSLQPGSVLILASDGVTEAMNRKQEFYGKQRLLRLVKDNRSQSPELLCNMIVNNVTEFRAKAPQTDDITLICMRIGE